MIGDFTGSKKAQFPYSLASVDNQEIYDPECVPDGFVLSDPEHIRTLGINLLYSHFIQRQNQGLRPFVILKCSPLHTKAEKILKKGKGKAKATWEDVSTDDEKDEIDVPDKENGDGSELEEEVKKSPAKKVGRQKQKVQQPPNDNSPVAGPSTLPPIKHGLKTDFPVKNTKKRKPEDDLLKVGPPKRKVQQPPNDDLPVAGSSTLPPVEHGSKMDLPVKKTKKRKAEGDLLGSPEKVAKKSGRKAEIDYSRNEKGSKRKWDVEQEPAESSKKLRS